MAGIAAGSTTIAKIALGSTSIATVSLGSALVWPTTVNVSDDFNRTTLGANWAVIGFNDTTIVPVINANRFRNAPTTTSNQNNQSAGLYTAAAAATDNHQVRAALGTAPNGLFSGLIVRASADFQNMMLALMTTDSANTGIWTLIGGTWTRRTTSSTSSLVAGDTVAFRAVGNVYTLVRNPAAANTTVSTWTDTGGLFAPGATRRYSGLYVHSDRNAFGTQNWSAEFDDFNFQDI